MREAQGLVLEGLLREKDTSDVVDLPAASQVNIAGRLACCGALFPARKPDFLP